MSPDELQALADRLLETARARYLREGRHESIAYLHVGGIPTSIAVSLTDSEDRAVVRRIFEAAAREGAEACALVTEARGRTGDLLLVVETASPAGHILRELIIDPTPEGMRLMARGSADPGAAPLLAGLRWPGQPGPTAP